MKISFNPSNSNKNILDLIKNNKDIIFDLKGHSIFARGVEFKGTDTNTWRDIKINNVSIGSHTLDLRNGSNTTLTNTNGVVTINSTWRPVVDNLTSDSTTSSLSAKQGKVLKALIDGKSNSDHNHDGRYVRYYAVTTLDCNNLAAGLTAASISATNAAHTNHSAYLYISDVGTPFQIQIPDSSIPYIYKRYYGSGKWSGWFKLNAGYADSAGSVAWANVTGKPSSYTPSAHTHAWNSLTHSSTTENQAILTNGKANGWKLYTLNISRWDNAANNAHSHANKSVLDGITSALVNSWNTAYNFVSNITGTDTDKVINKWEEIVNFLAGITEDNKLNTLLNSKLSIYELADNTNVGTIKNNGIYYSTTDASSGTLINSPFNTGFAFINMTSYDGGDDLRRSRLAFNAFGEIKVSDDRDQANTAETWYNVLTSKNSGINGSTIKLNGTSITVYSSGTADGRYVKKSGDTMSGVLTIDTTNFGALTIKRNDDANGASIQFRGKSSVYGYIGLNNSTKDKQFLRWSSDISRVYTILDTSSTYISNGKGVINGTTITQVDNADTLDGAHLSDIKNWSDRTASAYWKAGWYKVASAQTATNTEAFLTLDVNAANSKGHATLFIRKRADSKPYFICTHNNNLNLADFRLYYNGMSMVLYARVPNDWNGRVFRIISEGREGTYDHIWTLYSNVSSTDPNAISAEGGNPYINPTYSGRVDWSNSSDKANYANSAGSVAWNNVTGKPSAFNPAAHTHTVFKNNLMIKGTNGISDSASIHLGIGDSDTGFKWISDGVCQIYANNAAVGQWTSGGMDWFKNPTVNGNKVWNAGNDGSGSGLDSDLVDGLHASRFPIYYNLNMSSTSNHWYKLGTARISESDNIMIHIYSGNGWNSNAYQNAYATLMIKTGYNPNGGLTREFGATMVNHHHSNMTYKLISPSNDTVDIWVKIPWGYSSGWYSIHGEYSSYTHSGASQSAEPTGNAQTGVETLTNAYTSSNVASATKLATPRTIWGQSFDGTGNVSGSLSEVGNIHFKVDNSYDIGSDAAASRYIYTHWLGAKSGQKLELGANNSGFGQGLCIDTNLNVGIGTNTPTQKLDVHGYTHTKGFGIGIQYLSESELLPTISPGDGYTYRCLEIGRPTKVSCIIADKVPLSGVRGILLKFMQGFDGQIVLLKDLENYGSGNGYFWVMPSGCKIINADNSNILINQNQISNTYDDGRSRFFIYSSKYSAWIEFFCSNIY